MVRATKLVSLSWKAVDLPPLPGPVQWFLEFISRLNVSRDHLEVTREPETDLRLGRVQDSLQSQRYNEKYSVGDPPKLLSACLI